MRLRRVFRSVRSIEIDADVERVFDAWTRYEELPRVMHSVRRTLCIDERRVLWDVDVAGRQLVWEARILESTPEKLVRWESTWGTPNAGQVCFSALPERRTRLRAEIEFRPRGVVEQLGARIGLVDAAVDHDLERFRRSVEGMPSDADDEGGSDEAG